MKYKVSFKSPSSHYIDIECIAENVLGSTVQFNLPSWRPGRYELGNFAKNIQKWSVSDDKGNTLISNKISKDCWEVQTNGSTTIHIKYNYYAAQLDAGACWLDESQLYINGVHCFLYIKDRISQECTVELDIPKNWQVACGLPNLNNTLTAPDFHILVDCPFIASASLQHNQYTVNETNFHIWFQGECKPDWDRVLQDFKAFTVEQFKLFGDFPFTEYHYLVQVLPVRFYHGVEHFNSTVIGIGPGYNLMNGDTYVDFLGVNSHELFHAWNIKNIRPVEMYPYDYSRENYSKLGYVAEGVTTYYGDLILSRCNVYDTKQYLEEVSNRVQKHMDSAGRQHMPVASASFDTWLDGYVPGVPNRKTSIYDEGSLIALMTDFIIRKYTEDEKSLDDVMRSLYHNFGKKGKGYSEDDYKEIVKQTAGADLSNFFSDYVYGTKEYLPKLNEVLAWAGLLIEEKTSKLRQEKDFGFKTTLENGILKVASIAPESPAEAAGISKDDEIISVNSLKVENNLDALLRYFEREEIILTTFSLKKEKKVSLIRGKQTFHSSYKLTKIENPSDEQRKFFQSWSGQQFV